jgi:hypothetical protein
MKRHHLLFVLLLAGCSGKEGTAEKTTPPEVPSEKTGDPKERPAAFDPESGERTVRWLHEKAVPIFANQANDFATATALTNFRWAVESLKGKGVRWPLKVLSVRGAGVSPRPLEYPPSPLGLSQHYENPQEAPKGTFPAVQLDFHSPFAFKPRGEWVERLKFNDVVSTRGTVDTAKFEFIDGTPDRGLINITLTIEGATASPL